MVLREKPTTTALPDLTVRVDRGVYRIKDVAVHATGLQLPSHMGLPADGRVLVSEFGGGRVRDITEGGDYTDQTRGRYAWGMQHPGGVQPLSDGRILASDAGAGRIYDITRPGPVSDAALLFEGVPQPYGLVEFRDKLYTTFSNVSQVGMAHVEPGEQFSEERHAFVSGFPSVLTTEPYRDMRACNVSWTGLKTDDDQLLFAHGALGAIFNVTMGGTYAELRDRKYAWGLTMPLGMIVDPLDHNIYVCERSTGTIKRIARDGGYSRFAEPLVAGFQDPSCIRFTPDGARAYVCDRALDAVYRIELEHHA